MKSQVKILLVEDDPRICQNIHDYFFQEGYLVEIAREGLTAQKLMEEKVYDAIVLDINLPYKDGLTLCKEFRQVNSHTPILMLTAFDDLDDKMHGFEVGADDYLTKPFFMREVMARIKALLKRSKNQPIPESVSIIQMEDLTIDLGTQSVSRGKTPINLTPREFNLLLKLANAKGKLVTKRELNRDIWGGSLDENNNTIEVYINFLRKKIDKPFATNLIKTKVGFGYYLSSHEH
ncbi:response regulator transcription factor [Aquirufa aurantiipilula]|uniref:Response regulator transcription factor n=1 Tax=Aquirufa aurantiipilula TaxID=2696561 RepID=A0ABT6BGH8_9BACT|nr:response regulator transcription factor [Aquirufa aurantiipilula]MDF5689555.1 response regulator transcription factor [Aquirufa aurantiipilula]